MDLFNKKKVAALELALKNNENVIASLKSDVSILERDNDEMKLKLGEGRTMSARVKSAVSSYISSAKIKKDKPSEIITLTSAKSL